MTHYEGVSMRFANTTVFTQSSMPEDRYGVPHRLDDVFVLRLYAISAKWHQIVTGIPWDGHVPDGLIDLVRAEEQVTRHEMVAVLRVMETRFERPEMLHFLRTSEDIVNVAHALEWVLAQERIECNILKLHSALFHLSGSFNNHQSLARTHGQPALMVPTSHLFDVHRQRICFTVPRIERIKFGGIVGLDLSVDMAQKHWDMMQWLGFEREEVTTQISNRVEICRLLQYVQQTMRRLAALCVDVWCLCALGDLETRDGGIGSSAMPNKHNPHEFESAEGVAGFVIHEIDGLLEGLSASRLHRDLSDSSIQRFVAPTLYRAAWVINKITKAATTLALPTAPTTGRDDAVSDDLQRRTNGQPPHWTGK